jgi:putative phosphoribosyl transferase
MPFVNRTEAGVQLAAALASFRDQDPVVLALPRGGIPVAFEIARALDAPLDLIIARKIGVPVQPELAMGAVVNGDTPIVVRNDDVIATIGIGESEFDAVCARELDEIKRRRQRYIGDRPPVEIAGKTAIVVDDGIATGATVRAALRATRARAPKRLVLATPVAPNDTLRVLTSEVDETVCLESHDFFTAIGAYYDDFGQVGDNEVIALLAAAKPATSAPKDT